MHGTPQYLPRSICVVALKAAMSSTIFDAGPVSAKTYRQSVESAGGERI